MNAGYHLNVYNRDTSKIGPFVERGATRASRPADAVPPGGGGVVVSVLWDDASVDSVVRSDDFLSRLGKGGVHV